MCLKNLSLVLLFSLSLFALPVAAQPATARTTQSDELPKEIREKIVALLKTTAKDAAALTLPENRLMFLINTADLLWEHDDQGAREVFQNGMSDIRMMIAANAQKNAALALDEMEVFDSFLTGDGSATDAASIGNLREMLILALAKHDPETAHRFLLETRPVFQKTEKNQPVPEYLASAKGMFTTEERDNALEINLANLIAKSDPQRALEIALKKLSGGISNDLSNLTVKLYLKDQERGAKLANEILKKLKTTKIESDHTARSVALDLFKNAANALKAGEKKPDFAKNPLLAESGLRELAELIAKAGLLANPESDYEFQGSLDLLTKYAPVSAAQLKRKIEAPKVAAVKETGEDKDPPVETAASKYIERARKEEETMEALKKGVGSPDAKFSLEETRQSLAKIKNRTQRMTMMSQIASTLAERGEKDAAKELLTEAKKMVNAQPKFWAHYAENLVVAQAYTRIDPAISFEMLENMIFHLDDTISGGVKVAEFIAGETVMRDNELRLSGIPGMGSMNILGGFGGRGGMDIASSFDKDIQLLARADFDRTAALTNKFSRPEIRLIAQMLIIGSLLPREEQNEMYIPATIDADDETTPQLPPVPAPVSVPRRVEITTRPNR